MVSARKRSLQSLKRIIEDAPASAVRDFLSQKDENFVSIAADITGSLQALETQDNEATRQSVLAALLAAPSEHSTPVEVEAQRVLLLSEGKGPSALKVIAAEKLSNEDYEDLFAQSGELAVALHAHALHRRVFDDAVSFRNARLWRDGKLYSAFDVDLDLPRPLASAAIPRDDLLASIQRRLQLPVDCGLSVVDLPASDNYDASVLVIVRIPKDITGIAEHMNDGGRRIRFLRPQKEVLLIYTPSQQRIEICADTAPERAIVSECFATVVLEHNVSLKPLTWVDYDLSRFFQSLTLDPPDVDGFQVEQTSLVEIEFRLARWAQRIRLSVPFDQDIEKAAQAYLGPGRVLQRASGISRVSMVAKYRLREDEPPAFLEIAISDRNRCSLLSNRDPDLRRLGRTLLTEWKIQHPFRDLSEEELGDFLPLLLELYEEEADTVGATFFSERNCNPERLVEAKLIVRKGAEDIVIDDDDQDFPTFKERARYAISAEWLEKRIIDALHGVLSVQAMQKITSYLFFLGSLSIDGSQVPCYLAKGLSNQKRFIDTESRLRQRSAAGIGLVFCGQSMDWRCIGANLILEIPRSKDLQTFVALDQHFIESFYRANIGLSLGGTTLTLLEAGDGESGKLVVPGRPELPLLSPQQVRCFRMLVEAKNRGLPGVKTADLIEGTKSTGIQQMLGNNRWPVFRNYLEKVGYGLWSLKSDW